MTTNLETLTEIATEIDTLFTYGAFGIVNMMLSKAKSKIKEMPTDKLLAYARYASVAKDKLPIWESFITKLGVELIARNLDSERLLRGLI